VPLSEWVKKKVKNTAKNRVDHVYTGREGWVFENFDYPPSSS